MTPLFIDYTRRLRALTAAMRSPDVINNPKKSVPLWETLFLVLELFQAQYFKIINPRSRVPALRRLLYLKTHVPCGGKFDGMVR